MRYALILLSLIALLTVTLAAPIIAQDDGCAEPLRLAAGSIIYLKARINIRNLPTLSGGQVNFYEESVTLRVTGGPVCADGFNWWQVDGPDNPGWVAEGKPGNYYITIANPGPNVPLPCPQPVSIAGEVKFAGDVRVHETPSLDGRVLVVMPIESRAALLAGPNCAEGINWWQVRVIYPGTSAQLDGWVAEREGDKILLVPPFVSLLPTSTPAPCAPSYRRLRVGIQAYIASTDNTAKNLRTAPSLQATVIVTLMDGVGFYLLQGPVCSQGYNWWEVQIAGREDVTGWLAEGGSGNLWIRPLVYD